MLPAPGRVKMAAAVFAAAMLIFPAAAGFCAGAGARAGAGSCGFIPGLEADGDEDVFRVLRTQTGVTETVSTHEYVCGVVAAEMPSEYGAEALKAQAAAAFTYACRARIKNRRNPACAPKPGADISDDCSVYQAYISRAQAQSAWGASFAGQWGRIEAAVTAVRGKAVTYKGELINAVYFAASPGSTESSENVWNEAVPYLVPVPSGFDSGYPGWRSAVKLSGSELEAKALKKYPSAKFGQKPGEWIKILKISPSGTVLKLTLGGAEMTGGELQELLGLRSAAFSVSYSNPAFTFDVRGFGHDVGMSQYGAGCLAKKGLTWQQIIRYYYTGAEITDCAW
jgi:stage II sporulation protein D